MKFLRTKSKIDGVRTLINLDLVTDIIEVPGGTSFWFSEENETRTDMIYTELMFILKSNGLIIEEENE